MARPLLAFGLLLAVAAVGAQSTGAAEPQRRVFDFDVHLDRRPVGTHRFSVAQTGSGTLSVESDAAFDVRVLGIPAYRYRHRASERWSNDCLTVMEASTDDNGRRLKVSGVQRDGSFQLDAPAPAAFAGCISAYAYWNRDLLLRQRALLNPQTGKLDPLRVEPLGAETVELGAARRPAQRYRLHAGQGVIDVWYSSGGEWLRLESVVGSRRLIYRLREAPRP